jgi:hypothetical protein
VRRLAKKNYNYLNKSGKQEEEEERISKKILYLKKSILKYHRVVNPFHIRARSWNP